jgi:hypothetical protein
MVNYVKTTNIIDYATEQIKWSVSGDFYVIEAFFYVESESITCMLTIVSFQYYAVHDTLHRVQEKSIN